MRDISLNPQEPHVANRESTPEIPIAMGHRDRRIPGGLQATPVSIAVNKRPDLKQVESENRHELSSELHVCAVVCVYLSTHTHVCVGTHTHTHNSHHHHHHRKSCARLLKA